MIDREELRVVADLAPAELPRAQHRGRVKVSRYLLCARRAEPVQGVSSLRTMRPVDALVNFVV